MSRSVCNVVAVLAPKRHTVSSGISPPSTLRPLACGCPYEMAIRDGPVRLASSSYHESPMRREFRWTSTVAKLLAATRRGVDGAGGGAGGFCSRRDGGNQQHAERDSPR